MAEGTTTLEIQSMACKSSECSQIKTLMVQPLRNGDTRYKSNIVMLTIWGQNDKGVISQMSNWSSMVLFMEKVCWMGPMWFQPCRQSNFLSRMYRSYTPLERYLLFIMKLQSSLIIIWLWVENTTELNENLIEGIDVALLPEPAWQLLVQWYGLMPGQQPIACKV